MVKYKIGHYYRKDYFRKGKPTEYTIIKLKSVSGDRVLYGEIIATNMSTRLEHIGGYFGIFQPKTKVTRIYEVTPEFTTACAL